METLVILYYLYLSYGTVGQGECSILELSRWLRQSKKTMILTMEKLIEMGLAEKRRKFSKTGRSWQWMYRMTELGQEHLDNNHRAAYDAYKHQVATLIADMQAENAKPIPKPLSRRAKRQEKAGQKRLF